MDPAATKEAIPAAKSSVGTVSANGNGVNGVNGTHAAHKSAPPAINNAPPSKDAGGKAIGLKADRQGVTQAFIQFAQLLRASSRPLPTQTGVGTFDEDQTKTGLRKDLKYISWKGK